ncbi:MAG: right-handed parallel beta-helix repeat-containing protein, partial [Limisphaerales bacterium]
GVHMESGSSNLILRNGTITGWGGDGVDEVDNSATDGIYEHIHATGNSSDGLRLNEKCVITACKLDHNTGNGVSTSGRATIKDCTASNNGLDGIHNGNGDPTTGRATIKDCTASDNGVDGIYFGSGSVIDSVASSNGDSGIVAFDEPAFFKNCVAFDHNGGGAGLRSGAGGKFSDCISRYNSFGIDVGYFGNVTNCTLKNNGNGIFGGGSNHIVGNMLEGNGDGISLYENRNVIDGNQVINGGTGIHIQTLFAGGGIRNLIIRNTVGNNTTNFDIVAGNRFGPIVDITTGATPAVSGNSAADTTTTTHPWANLTYCQEPP